MENEHHPSRLGKIIRQQREVAELSMRQLASMVGISNPYLSQIEHGLRAPSERVLQAIAASLRTTADALVAEATPPGDGPPDVLIAITADPNLTARQRQALSEAYTAMTQTTIARRGRRTGNTKRPGA